MDREPQVDQNESPTAPPNDPAPPADVEDLLSALAGVVDDADHPAAREEGHRLENLLAEARERGVVGSGVRRLDAGDAVQAFVGSVIFAAPLLVEDGVFDIAAHLVGVSARGVPVFLVANTLFVVVVTHALLEWTGQDRVETHRIFGRVPTRMVMVLVVSFLTAAVLMTVWGRVGGWRAPTEALARINVIWTVGSLGAALGDIVSGDDVGPGRANARSNAVGLGETGVSRSGDGTRKVTEPASPEDLTDAALLGAIHDQFESLESVVDGAGRREIRRLRERTDRAALDDVFGDRIRKYTGRDVAEAFVGSIFFSIPFLVEDGVFDVAGYFLSVRVGGFPVFFAANTAFLLAVVATLVYWAGPRDVAVSRPILGVVPRRLVGIAAVSLLTAAALMTMWGRVAGWADPVVAVARISVVWTIAAFGAALGDILPGESSGDDINVDLSDLGDRVAELVD